MKCTIKWIDSRGNETPDSNVAIGMAECTTEGMFKIDHRYPICSVHAKRLLNLSNWQLHPFDDMVASVKREFGDTYNHKGVLKYDYTKGLWIYRLYRNEFEVDVNGTIHW